MAENVLNINISPRLKRVERYVSDSFVDGGGVFFKLINHYTTRNVLKGLPEDCSLRKVILQPSCGDLFEFAWKRESFIFFSV